ncbi:MAG: ribose-phosphate pyrophosphokinase [Candidatus ainarchaeum sp.]|nr:ribose-phosphate pyrophosphokinase [Candidatus ainarchaeum sp.]
MDCVNNNIKLFCGTSNKELGEKIASNLKIKLGEVLIKKFANDETYIQFQENIRGADVFLLQTAVKPINENLIELLLMIDAAKRASARRITIITPNYFYSRQDRKAAPRESITAKLIADLITTAGANRILTIDLHSDQTQGFFNIPFDNLPSKPFFLQKAIQICDKKEQIVVVSPDAGAAKKATKMSIALKAELAIINKIRTKHNEAQALNIIGANVLGKDCLIFDDMIDTGGSLCLAIDMLKQEGAKRIFAFTTHGILSENAIEKINSSKIDKLFITNSLPFTQKSDKIEVIDISGYLANAIKNIHEEESVSQLF